MDNAHTGQTDLTDEYDQQPYVDRLLHLVNVLADHLDHPDLWKAFHDESFDRDGRSQLRRLLTLIIAMTPDQTDVGVRKTFAVLTGLLECLVDDMQLGLQQLIEAELQYSQCPLVAGALFFAHSLTDQTNPKYNLQERFCAVPFQQMDVLSRSTHLCCASWVRTSIGSLRTTEWQDVWNSPAAINIRDSIHDGSFRFCNKMLCPKIQQGSLPMKTDSILDSSFQAVITERQSTLDQPPRHVNLSYDATCNLSCPSCRTEKIATDNATRAAYSEMQEKSIMPLLKGASTVFITGSGDPFASKNFRDVLMRITPQDYPNLKILLMTNALLLTPSEWQKFRHLAGKIERINVSIDGATKESHELTRRGSNWEKLKPNLRFIGDLTAEGAIGGYFLKFVVQDTNFHEMGMAVDLAHEVGATGIEFRKISNWGTYTPEQFRDKAVFSPHHPRYAEFLKATSDPRLADPCVEMFDFREAALYGA